MKIEVDRQVKISPLSPPYVIAEIGTNHNRDLDTAKKLVMEIAETGSDCVKFQIYEPDEIVSRKVMARDYGLDRLYGDITAQEMFANFLLTPKSWFPELSDLCHKLGMDCAVTVHGKMGVEWSKSIDLDLIKVASMDHTNIPLLSELINSSSRPILISFGMAVLEDIDAAISLLGSHKPGVGIFHCVAIYPPTIDELRLSNIRFFSDRYIHPVGFSDHTIDAVAALAARRAGAMFFEKHVTLDRSQLGPDHGFAMEMDDFRSYVTSLKNTEMKEEISERELSHFSPLSEREYENRIKYMKSLTVRYDLPKGHRLNEGDIYLVRPGSGLSPAHLAEVIGKKLSGDILADSPLGIDDLVI